MPRVPYQNRRNRAYRALLTATVRTAEMPPCNTDVECADYGIPVRNVEPFIPQYDWRQLKYLMNCLVKDGLAYKKEGRRGVVARYWPVGGLELVTKRERMKKWKLKK